MKRIFKSIIGVVCGAALCLGAVSMTACGNEEMGYDGVGSEYIVQHSDGQKVRYTFEAENTNLTNKQGPGASNTYFGETMVLSGVGASNGYCVNGLGQNGVSLNFIIVSDREVEDATLILRLGSELDFSYTLDADMYQVRIDPVNDLDLNDYNNEEASGAWGMWDEQFLDVYNDEILPFAGYYLTEYYCGDIYVEPTENDPSGFEDYTVSVQLKLWKGVNSISLITNNDVKPSGTNNATMTATAPIVDCIKIETTAQLGLYMPQNNLKLGISNACTYVAV